MLHDGLRGVWERGETAFNCWLSSAAPLQAEMIGGLGFDSVVIDCQHGAATVNDVGPLCLALAARPSAPLVRVPWNDPAAIMRALDLGAAGVMAPLVNCRADAEKLVRACRYPPAGERSFGPIRAHLQARVSVREYFDSANDAVLAIAQIETAEAMGNLDEILSTPGLDMAYIGPADLLISHGGPPVIDHSREDLAGWHAEVIAAGRRHGVRVGLHAVSPEDVRLSIEQGADLVTVANDMAEMVSGTSQRLAAARSLIGAATEARPSVAGYGSSL
jgi:4-hydroxy-2-oxoheptanedioate aldolase